MIVTHMLVVWVLPPAQPWQQAKRTYADFVCPSRYAGAMTERNQADDAALPTSTYTITEFAELFGTHSSTASRVARR